MIVLEYIINVYNVSSEAGKLFFLTLTTIIILPCPKFGVQVNETRVFARHIHI